MKRFAIPDGGRRRLLLAGVGALTLVQCQFLGGIDEVFFVPDAGSEGGTDGNASGDGPTMNDGGTDAPADAVTDGPCGAKRGSTMALVAPTQGGRSYCIDTTEATIGQYEGFLDHLLAGSPIDVPGYCDTYVRLDKPENVPMRETNKARYALPRTDVRYCHAWAYCKWAGKRLCEKIGGGPTIDREGGGHTPNIGNEWDYACMNGLQNTKYAYGPTASATTCNLGQDFVAVQSKPDCRGKVAPFDSIFDMSGNVPEYVHLVDPARTDGGSPSTRITGGRYGDGDNDDGACGWSRAVDLDYSVFAAGIRCCADVP